MPISLPNIRVKLVTRSGRGTDSVLAKQCPGGLPRWGRCEFISELDCRDYDWFVVIDDIPRVQPGKMEPLACPRANTILVTSEPSSVARYGRAFAAQFAKVLTFQEEKALPHANATRTQTGNIWFYGKSFDELEKLETIEKTQMISTVCSSKRQAHTMHALRYDFTQKLKAKVPDLEIFGHGVRYIEKKSEALDPFKFHLVVENHIALHQWTEKLADAFLAYTVPIYCGCPNVFDYFPEDSVIPIDINDFEGSLKTVRLVLQTEGEYERRLSAVKEARRLIMYEYNLPAMLNRIITEAEPAESLEAGTIYCRQAMRVKHPADFVRFAAWRIGNFLQKCSSLLKRSR